MVKVVRVGERGSEGRSSGRLDDLRLSPVCMVDDDDDKTLIIYKYRLYEV